MNSPWLVFVGVGQAGDAILDRDQRAPDQTTDGLGKEQVSAQVGRQAIAAEDVLAAGGGEMVEGVVRAQLAGTALRVGHAGDRPDDFVLADEFVRCGELAVDDVLLKVHRAGFVAGVDEPDLAPVVLRESPLAAVDRNRFLHRFPVGAEAQAVVVVSRVDAVVHGPHETVGLVLHVAAALAAREPQGLLVGYAVTIAVAVDIEVIGIRLADDDAVIEREHDARQE